MSQDLPYRPIRPKKVADQVFEQLRDLIFRGQLKPSQRLPSERELAETMGVSRPTVREAVGRLVHLGLMEQHQGQGTFVTAFNPDQSRNPLSIITQGEDVTADHLLEVRLGLECNSAVLAARRADEEDIALLEKSLAEMQAQIDKGGLGHQEDASFHMRLAYATKNPVQILLMKHFYDLLFAGIRENLEHLYQDGTNKNLVHRQHQSVLAAIKARDTKAAFDAMLQHIRFVMDHFEKTGS